MARGDVPPVVARNDVPPPVAPYGRWPADGPLVALAVLGAAFLAALIAFVARATLPFDPFVACRTMAATVIARMSTVGLLLPLWLMCVVVVAAGIAAAHQLWVTRRVLGRLLVERRPLDKRLRALASAAGLAGKLDLVGGPAVLVFCYGLRRPRVCVSEGLAQLLNDDELLAVLGHEAHHLRHRDPLKILISRVLASGLFFLPLAGALRDGFLAGKELCADADAGKTGGDLPLARALLKLLRTPAPRWPAGVLAVGAFSPTDLRLARLLDPSQELRPVLPGRLDWLLTAVLVCVIFGFSYGTVAAGHDEHVQAVCANGLLLRTAGTGPGAAAGIVERINSPEILTHKLEIELETSDLLLPPARQLAPAPALRWDALTYVGCTVGLSCLLPAQCEHSACH